MRSPPRLVPIAPNQGQAVAVDRSPFFIGSGSGCGIRVYLPGVGDRVAAITEREDGYYISPFPGGRVSIAGEPLSAPTKLRDAQTIELGPTARWEFVTGEPRIVERPPEPEPAYEDVTEPGRRRRRWRRRRTRTGRVGYPVWAIASIILLVAAVGLGGYLLVQTIRGGSQEGETAVPPLTEAEGRLYDSLMVESTRSIERGTALLELELDQPALEQFARAIAIFEQSVLATNPAVRPSIEALVSSVRQIYQEQKGKIPSGVRATRGRIARLSQILSAELTPEQFRGNVEAVQLRFKTQFSRQFEITGRDHAEHLSLYGPGGALDVRTRDLSGDQIQFLIAGFQTVGIRVKDFSKDAILQAQIRAAQAKGRSDLAGTGLHLHVDRFRDRRDKWTVSSAIDVGRAR